MSDKPESAVIIGTTEIASILQRDLKKKAPSCTIKTFTEDTSEASEYIMAKWPDAVYCSLPVDHTDAAAIYHSCELTFSTYHYVIKPNNHSDRLITASWCKEPLKIKPAAALKRTFDVVVSGLFLITFYPFIFAFCAIGIKLSSPGPIYFKQMRPGYHGENFQCYKFRSMKVNRQSEDKAATKGDSRVTRFGEFMRKTSLDEFPQFINVFLGDMSLVGPRPQLINQSDYYSPYIPNYFMRHLVKPGITGWAQINGCRGEMKTIEEMNRRINHDIWYIEHWTPLLDIKILFKTVAQVLGKDKQAY